MRARKLYKITGGLEPMKWQVTAETNEMVIERRFATEHEAEEFGFMLYGKGYDNVEVNVIV